MSEEQAQPDQRPPEPPPQPGDTGDTNQPPRQHEMRLAGFDTEIWFENPPNEVDRKLQYSLGRLHVNMGHAPKAELVRMLAASGNLSRKVRAGLDCLRCGSCLRTRLPRQPPPSASSTNFSGFFGEVIQSDIVYLRLIDGTNVPVLGITCEATSYHAAKVLNSRQPPEVLASLIEIWYRPLGLPLRVRCDPGGEYGGEVTAFHARHGVIHETVPAEAHFRVGKIERRNALMRSLVERVVDERAVARKQDLDQCLVAVLHTMNACTFSRGRSPAQAVFGRIARPLGDLLSDPLSLVISPEIGFLRSRRLPR